MSLTLQFKLTQSGQIAVWNANNTGTALNLTHIQFGSGNRTPTGNETQLINPQQAAPIAAGFSVSATQIRMSAIFSGNQSYLIREVGLWAGDPAVTGSKLVGYWSQASGELASKSPGVDFIFSHDLSLDAALPAGSLTILADNTQSALLAMLTAHEEKPDPHPQYATNAEVNALIEARVGDYVNSTNVGNAYTVMLDPLVTAYNAKTSFTFKAAAANSGASTLNAGGGAKALLRDDGMPLRAGDIAAGAVMPVVFDSATDAFRVTKSVASQLAAAIQAQTYTAFSTTGSAPNFSLTPSPAIPAYVAGQRWRVKFGAAGNGADTLNVSGLGAKSLKQYDATGTKIAASIVANQLADVEYDGIDFVLLDPLPLVAMPLSALSLPVIDNSTGTIPVTATAVAGNGGTVSLALGTAFTLGMEVAAGVSAFTQSCASTAWTSPALVVNAEYFLRAQFVSGVLTFYVQRGTLADVEPASRKGTVNGASGGGFYSTTLDICLARILTGAAGVAPSIQKIINRRSGSWTVTLNGTGTVYMPIDPFTKNARIIAGNATPHTTLVTGVCHGSGGWTGANYSYIAPNMPTGSLGNNIYWVSGGSIIIGSNNIVGDMFVSTSAATFDHAAARSIWQVFQTEHAQGDTSTSSTSDELLLGTGTKTMLQSDYDNGLAVNYTNAVNVQFSWEIMR